MNYRRPQLLSCYCELQAKSLQKLRNISYDEALEFVKQQTSKYYTPMKGTIIKSKTPGNIDMVDIDVLRYLESIADKVITPSGSIYKTKKETPSVMADMIVEKMSERKTLKKKQFKAAADGNKNLERLYKYQQTTVKVICNSLPGGFASPYNIMYDKGGYNSITSTGRAMIGLAITTAEQLIGGNFSWFSEEDLYNYILIMLEHCPTHEIITNTITKYRLKPISAETLLEYYQELLRIYVPNCNMGMVGPLISTLQDHEIIFLYYYCNMRNIIWNNEDTFRPFFEYLFNYDNLDIQPTVTIDDLYSHDEAIIALTTVVFADRFAGMSLDDISSNQEQLAKLVALCKLMKERLDNFSGLFSTFINLPVMAPNIHKKPNTLRNTVIISDTDSVIFSAASWDKWYRGNKDNINHQAYQITAIVIYWLHVAVKYIMKHFSIVNCVDKDNLSVLAMKNEFLYPIMLLYDIRKTYVGVIAVQEGRILPQPEPDIKGQTLKGSMFCDITRDFTRDFITDEVLFKSMEGKLSAGELIEKVIRFENRISESIDAGSTEFFKIASLKSEDEYKNADVISVIKAWRFWQEVMSPIYGSIIPPGKVQMFPTITASVKYTEWLKQKHSKTYKRFIKYLENNRVLPNNLIVNPLLDKVPPELIPLVNKREIIFHNVQPIYSVLERISISIGNEKDKLLFSDVYSIKDQ